MGFAEFFGWNVTTSADELPELFGMPITQTDFVKNDVVTIYSKILTDVLERTQGIPEEKVPLLWDNCLKSSLGQGLVTMLAGAMAEKKDLFLVFDKATDVLRPATQTEQQQIEADYKSKASSSVGIFVSFTSYRRSDMVAFYLTLQYCTIASLYKSMNVSKSLQFKISDLRKSVSLVEADGAKAQAKRMADAMAAGRDILMDAKDELASAVPELEATNQAVKLVIQKLSFYLGLPDAYLTGEQTGGIGASGEQDMRAVERGLKSYFFSIVKPVLEALFTIKVSYKSQDFRQILSGMDALKTFSLTDDALVSSENKRKMLNSIFGLEEDAKGDPAPKQDPKLLPEPGKKPPVAEA
jgi:hypothetical protein